MKCKSFSFIFGFLMAGVLALAETAHAVQGVAVIGTGSGRPESNAKSRARIDAQKQCLDRVGAPGVKRTSDFSVVTVRPNDTGLHYLEASASFECTGADQCE